MRTLNRLLTAADEPVDDRPTREPEEPGRVEPSSGVEAIRGHVLVVDHDDHWLRTMARLLSLRGFQVTAAADLRQATKAIECGRFDAVVADIDMPEGGGVSLLESSRAVDPDLPVVFVTARPTVETAAAAVQHQAFRYLCKPIAGDTLARVLHQAANLSRWARQRRLSQVEAEAAQSLRAGLDASLTRALDALWMAFQPIVSWRTRTVVAYEALMRSREPTLPFPDRILRAAEQLGRTQEVGRVVRARVAAAIPKAPPGVDVFVNLHSNDLLDDDLFAESAPLTRHARRVVLEITERASLGHVRDVRAKVRSLRELGFRVAVDDLGAGFAGLSSLATIAPEIVKIDMSLIRGMDTEPVKEKLVQSILSLAADLHLSVVAEGVEVAEEREALDRLSCPLMQGYLFARPGEGFPSATL